MRWLAVLLASLGTASAAPECQEAGAMLRFGCTLEGAKRSLTVCELDDSNFRFRLERPDGTALVLTAPLHELFTVDPAQTSEPGVQRLGFWEEGWLHEINVVPQTGGAADAHLWTFGPAREDHIGEEICLSGSVVSNLPDVLRRILD